MAKIIRIRETSVSVGMDDASITEVPVEDLDFSPNIDDEVEVINKDGKVHLKRIKECVEEKAEIFISDKAFNKNAYCLITFLLGWLGINKLYTGKVSEGLICLLFFWTGIPFILSLIEFFKTINKRTDSFGNILIN